MGVQTIRRLEKSVGHKAVSHNGSLMELKRSHEPITIRLWKRADINYVAKSISREGWPHSRRDVIRCWNLEPKGCFIAELDSSPVGHVFSVCYGKMGWIGLLIVNPEARELGIGSVLMKAAVSYLQETGCESIRLDAVEKAVPLYKRLGFVEEFDSLRFRGQLRPMKKAQVTKVKTFEMQEDDVEDVSEFDAKYFGANRLRVLQSLYGDNPHRCFIAGDRRSITGYIMVRAIKKGFWVGPMICENAQAGLQLINALIKVSELQDAELRLGIPALNVDGKRLVRRLGFDLTGKSIHMVCGDRTISCDVAHVYGIAGAEKG